MASFRCYDNSDVIATLIMNLQEFFGQMVYRPPWPKIARKPMVHAISSPFLPLIVQLVEPRHSEEDCLITTISENKRLSRFFCKRTSNIHKFEGCFLRGQVRSNGLKVFNRGIAESWILLVHLQKPWESFVFRNRCDGTIFIQEPRFEYCKASTSNQICNYSACVNQEIHCFGFCFSSNQH